MYSRTAAAVVTAVVSVAFSYVSLHTWFAARERPATIERALYDELNAAAGKSLSANQLLFAQLAPGAHGIDSKGGGNAGAVYPGSAAYDLRD